MEHFLLECRGDDLTTGFGGGKPLEFTKLANSGLVKMSGFLLSYLNQEA
jgi:hypothetical protein